MSEHTKPKKGSVVVLVALAIVLAGIGARWYLNRAPSSASAAPTPQPTPSATVTPTGAGRGVKPSAATVKVPSIASAAFRRDPFTSAVVFPPKPVVDPTKPVQVDVNAEVIAAAKKELRLTAIVVGEKPLAIISGQTCREGDMVGRFRVERIGQFEVVLEQRGVRVRLSKE
jgi:hypothetical protein